MLIDPKAIMRAAEKAYYLPEGVIMKHCRTKRVANCRAVSMYYMKCIANFSYYDVGFEHRRDHSSVVHNCQKIKRLLEEKNEEVIQALGEISCLINQKL